MLPSQINGLPTDVEEVGLFHRFASKPPRHQPNPRLKFRPAQPGCSIGFKDPANQIVMAGTFGALVKDAESEHILSDNHVLADENRLKSGAPIFQPGLLDKGNARTEQIAELTSFISLNASGSNKVDCAIAKPFKSSLVSRDIVFIGAPKGAGTAAIDMTVHKFGRTSGYRAGKITSIDTDVAIQYQTGRFTFESQIIVVGLNNQPFSDSGDSGSLILNRQTQEAVALLFGGSKTHTIANHIEDVLHALNVKLA